MTLRPSGGAVASGHMHGRIPARRGHICGGMMHASYLMMIWMIPSPFLMH